MDSVLLLCVSEKRGIFMKNKTIGSFISSLRKSKGLTQRELAEMLNVSDKAISRWERDECAPDILLIPVIADIFGVTSDEILRGERASIATEGDIIAPVELTDRALKAILMRKKSDFSTMTLWVYLCAVLAVIGAMICNFAFIRATLGFFIGVGVLAVGIFLLVFISKRSILSTDSDMFSKDMLGAFKREIIISERNCITAIASAFMLILPFSFVDNAYFGLTYNTWFILGPAGALIAFAVSKIVFSFITVKESEAEKYYICESELNEIRQKNLRIKMFLKRLALITACFAVVLVIFNTVAQSTDYFSARKFETLEDAQRYIDDIHKRSPEGIFGNGDVIIESEVEILFGDDNNIDKSTSEDNSLDSDKFPIINAKGQTVAILTDERNEIFKCYVSDTESAFPVILYTYYARGIGESVVVAVDITLCIIYLAFTAFVGYKTLKIKEKEPT